MAKTKIETRALTALHSASPSFLGRCGQVEQVWATQTEEQIWARHDLLLHPFFVSRQLILWDLATHTPLRSIPFAYSYAKTFVDDSFVLVSDLDKLSLYSPDTCALLKQLHLPHRDLDEISISQHLFVARYHNKEALLFDHSTDTILAKFSGVLSAALDGDSMLLAQQLEEKQETLVYRVTCSTMKHELYCRVPGLVRSMVSFNVGLLLATDDLLSFVVNGVVRWSLAWTGYRLRAAYREGEITIQLGDKFTIIDAKSGARKQEKTRPQCSLLPSGEILSYESNRLHRTQLGGAALLRESSFVVASNPDAVFVFVGAGGAGAVRSYDLSRGELRWEVKLSFSRPGAALSSDGSLLCVYQSGEGVGRALVLDAKTGEHLWSLEGPLLFQASFSPDSERLVVVRAGGAIELYHSHRGEQLAAYSLALANIPWASARAWSLYWHESKVPLLVGRLASSIPEPAWLICFDIETGNIHWSKSFVDSYDLSFFGDCFIARYLDGQIQTVFAGAREHHENRAFAPKGDRVFEAHLLKDKRNMVGVVEFGGVVSWMGQSATYVKGTEGAGGPIVVSPDESLFLVAIAKQFIEAPQKRPDWAKKKARGNQPDAMRVGGDMLQLWERATQTLLAQWALPAEDLVRKIWFLDERRFLVETVRGAVLMGERELKIE